MKSGRVSTTWHGVLLAFETSDTCASFFHSRQPIRDFYTEVLGKKKSNIHLYVQMEFFLSNVNRKLWQVFTVRLTIRT